MAHLGMNRSEADALAAEIACLGPSTEVRECCVPGRFEMIVTAMDGRSSVIEDGEGWRRYGPRILGQAEAASDGDSEMYWAPGIVVGLAAGLANDVGVRDVQMYRNSHRGRGLDIESIVQLVVAADGAEPTPLPSTEIWSEIRVIEEGPHFRRLTCPLWTEAGRSSLELVVWMEPSAIGHGILDFYVEQVRDGEGRTLLEVAPDRRMEDPAWLAEPWTEPIGHGGDSRIRRASYVGASAGMLTQLLLNGLDKALGDAQEHRAALNEGQRAVLVLVRSFDRLYGDGLEAVYSTTVGDMAPELPAAARLVGADRVADIFERANALIPSEMFFPGASRDEYMYEHFMEDTAGQQSMDALERELNALESAGESIWPYILKYVDDHAVEFFHDAEG